MKIISTLLVLTFFSFSVFAQPWKITAGYSLGTPRQVMKKNIPPAHSLQAGVLYQLPGQLARLAVGTELGIGIYANKRIEQTFQFDNNTASLVPVNYTSNVFNANIQARYDLLSKKNFIIPYIQAKGGVFGFFSNVLVEDPEDPDGCHALERENIINDKTMYWSAGGGLQINPGIFAKRKQKRNTVIDLSVNSIRGGTVNYINTRNLVDAQNSGSPESKPLHVRFINANTQAIHEHTVAQVHNSVLRMLEIRAGIMVNLGN